MKRIALLLLLIGFTASAVEVAPRISDREIIESLAELKAGQKAMEQRFEAVDQRFDQMQNTMDQRFEAVDQRFGQLHGTMVSMFSVLGALLIALFGYMVWDRRTAFKPFEERFNALEKDLICDLQLRDENGSLLTRLTLALRKLAQDDPQVASVLKSFSLL